MTEKPHGTAYYSVSYCTFFSSLLCQPRIFLCARYHNTTNKTSSYAVDFIATCSSNNTLLAFRLAGVGLTLGHFMHGTFPVHSLMEDLIIFDIVPNPLFPIHLDLPLLVGSCHHSLVKKDDRQQQWTTEVKELLQIHLTDSHVRKNIMIGGSGKHQRILGIRSTQYWALELWGLSISFSILFLQSIWIQYLHLPFQINILYVSTVWWKMNDSCFCLSSAFPHLVLNVLAELTLWKLYTVVIAKLYKKL